MKVQLVYDKNEEGEEFYCGYIMTAENESEVEQLGIIRDYYFWKDMVYDGRKDFIDRPGVKSLGFKEKTALPSQFDSIWSHIKPENK